MAAGAPSAGGEGAGIDSRRGFGGGARRRDEAPGGTESVRGGGITCDVASTTIDSSTSVIDGELLRAGGGGGRPLDRAAVDPGGGRLGVPTETTRWLGIFVAGGGWLTGGTLGVAAGGGTLGGWLVRSEDFVVMKP